MLNQILQTIGHNPTAITKSRATYRSPFNPQEKTPSFCVFPNSSGEWKHFKDYSSGIGGDIYKFLMQYYQIGFIEAKQKLQELTGVDYQEHSRLTPVKASLCCLKAKIEPKIDYTIRKIQNLQNQALINYLMKRGISMQTVQCVPNGILGEIYYQRGDNNFFSIVFTNNSGGYVTRNKHPKSKINLGKEDITTIINPSKQIKIFEGFFDYLSYLEMTQNTILSDYIILNSVSHTQRALKLIQGKYGLIELYLDNDKSGDEATERFIKNNSRCKVIDKRKHYKNFKDLNEFLLKNDRIKQKG